MLKADVLKYYKTAVAAGKALGITHQAVLKWGAVVPWASALELQTITAGLLRRDERLYENRKPKPNAVPPAKE